MRLFKIHDYGFILIVNLFDNEVYCMTVSPEKVGAKISTLRKSKQLTQNELGERLNISFQAVSKWERGETLPDTSILVAVT